MERNAPGMSHDDLRPGLLREFDGPFCVVVPEEFLPPGFRGGLEEIGAAPRAELGSGQKL